jgi:3-oxoacyl-[acyl-carrier-protein] synthase-3
LKRDFEHACLVAGVGSAVSGVDGVPGMLVDHRIFLRRLVEHGTHNPFNGKAIDMGWARRYLGSDTVAVGLLDPLVEHLGLALPDGVRSATEWDLIAPAAEGALARARVTWEALDCIIHVSPTIAVDPAQPGPVGFQDGLREFPRRYPVRQDCAMLHLQHGCSGALPAIYLARALLRSGQCRRVLVVTSNWGGRFRDCPRAIELNDIGAWISGLLFGDAASALVLVDRPDDLQPGDRWLEVQALWRRTDPEVWIARYNHLDGIGSFPSINPMAAKSLFINKLKEVVAEAGVRLADCELLAIHQPNSEIVQQINETLLDGAGVEVLDIAARYGNLISSSAVTNLCEALHGPDARPVSDGGQVFMFTLGADAGMTYGGCLMRHHVMA